MVTVGEEVRVFDVNGERRGQPPGGWPGKVTKVGTKLVTIDYGHGPVVFRLGTRRTNDTYQHLWFETMEQLVPEDRARRAKNVLHQHGLRMDHGLSAGLSLSKLEAIANILESGDI